MIDKINGNRFTFSYLVTPVNPVKVFKSLYAEIIVPVKFQAQLRHGSSQGADEIAGLQRVQDADR